MTAKAKTPANGGPAIEWATYNRADAERALATNERNRSINGPVVVAYARDMLAGDWQQTGEAIKFAKSGRLIDGQHRLLALVEAANTDPDITVTMLTIYGLDDDLQRVFDTGRRRSQSDALQIAGYRNTAAVAAAARLVIGYENRALRLAQEGRRSAVTNTVLFDWLEQHPEFEPFVAQHISTARRTELPPAPITAAYWILSRRDPYKAGEFVGDLITLEGQGAGSPVLALHRMARSIRATRQRMYANQWLGLIFKAWNKYRAGETVGVLRAQQRDAFPYPEFDDDVIGETVAVESVEAVSA